MYNHRSFRLRQLCYECRTTTDHIAERRYDGDPETTICLRCAQRRRDEIRAGLERARQANARHARNRRRLTAP